MNTLKTDDGTLLKSTDLFAVGLRVRYDNMEGAMEENADYIPDATLDDYASGKIAPRCMHRWIVRSGSDGFFPEAVLVHGGELFAANTSAMASPPLTPQDPKTECSWPQYEILNLPHESH